MRLEDGLAKADEVITIAAKENVSESDYHKALMDMYYSNPCQKRQEVVEEFVVDTHVSETINEETISETPKQEVPKNTFLTRFLKKFGDFVEKIE